MGGRKAVGIGMGLGSARLGSRAKWRGPGWEHNNDTHAAVLDILADL